MELTICGIIIVIGLVIYMLMEFDAEMKRRGKR